MSYLLALDQGTTSSRALVFDGDARVRAMAQQDFEQHYPQPGWVEHDPVEIWNTQTAVAEAALAQAGVSAKDIRGLGITNQRETTVVWDADTGVPIHHAVVWQDRRTAPVCDALRSAGHEALVRSRTGLLLDPYFSGTKIAWLLDHVAGARERADAGGLRFGTIDSWLIWNLTEGERHVTDASNASRTMLFDIHRGAWDDDLLELLRVPRSLLPEVVPSLGVVAEVEAPVALAGIPIAGIAGDQQAALFGQGCFEAGQAKCTYGTGCFLLLHTGTQATANEQQLLTTVAWHTGAHLEYALEGSVFVGGAVVQWLRDGLGLIDRAADVEALANTVTDTGGVVLVPAFSGLGAPHWDAYARGTVLGLTRGTTRGHLARAALASIAHQVADVLEAMNEARGAPAASLRVDGGAAANDTLMQMQADLLGVPVLRPANAEITALGAARLAGLATGVYPSRDALVTEGAEQTFEPQGGENRSAARSRWRDAVERAKGWARP